MAFLRLFDVLDFDKNGKLCESPNVDINQARSNYLYLVSKYNQMFLQDEKLQVPEFFKNELGEVLQAVEKGGDFKQAKAKVLKNCLLKTQLAYEKSTSDKDFIAQLNGKVVVRDLDFAKCSQGSLNHLSLAYIITLTAGKVEQQIEKLSQQEVLGKAEKSKLYKSIIRYNGLLSTAEKVSKYELSVEDFKDFAN